MVVYTLEQRFAKWACDRLIEDVDFGKKKKNHLFRWRSFWSWRVKNCHIWDTENTHAYIKMPTHPKRVTVWCGFWSRGIIGPSFSENEQGEATTVNGDCYRAILNEFLFTIIEEEDIGNIWFQQDGATSKTAEATLDGLRNVLEDRIISRRADVVSPPRICDLTPLDYYLRGAVKDKCYADKPEIVEDLKDNIQEAIDEIQLHTINNVLKN